MTGSLRPSIVDLLLPCSPAAVARLVVAVVIDAIKSQTFWSRTHVGAPVFKRAKPAVTDSNSPPAVVSPALIVRVGTALNHACPDSIFRRCLTLDRLAMLGISQHHFETRFFSLKAATTLSIASPQSITANGHKLTAVADAQPENVITILPILCEDDEPSETLANQVKLGVHLEAFLSGVKRTVVTATRPPYFSSKGVVLP